MRAVVQRVSTRVAVMYLGQVVEIAPSQELSERPRHPYTRALLSAEPIADPDRADARQRIVLKGEVPSPTSPPAGCRFHPRCPKAQPICQIQTPPLQPRFLDGATHATACHFPLADGESLAYAHESTEQ